MRSRFSSLSESGVRIRRFLGFLVSSILRSFMYRRGRIPGSRVGIVSCDTGVSSYPVTWERSGMCGRDCHGTDLGGPSDTSMCFLRSIDAFFCNVCSWKRWDRFFCVVPWLVWCWRTIHHCLVGSRKDPWSSSIYFDPRATCVPFGFRCLRASPGRSSIPCLSLVDRLGFFLVSWAMSFGWHEPRGSVLSNPSWDGKVQHDHTVHHPHPSTHGCLPTSRTDGAFPALFLVSFLFGLVLR